MLAIDTSPLGAGGSTDAASPLQPPCGGRTGQAAPSSKTGAVAAGRLHPGRAECLHRCRWGRWLSCGRASPREAAPRGGSGPGLPFRGFWFASSPVSSVSPFSKSLLLALKKDAGRGGVTPWHPPSKDAGQQRHGHLSSSCSKHLHARAPCASPSGFLS